ncbi:UNVERIFIED_CONTAM: hypothetical protein HDU68_004284 [Siphonaria sp. JEL0065]|nr:hypothetical protein HDU68_004284 [Siphonaria sp. JEL0065]
MSEADKWDFAIPQHTSAFLAGSQVTSSIAYAIVFGISSFVVELTASDKFSITVPLQAIFALSYLAKLVQMFYFRQGSVGWNYRIPREFGAFVAGCQLSSLVSLAAVFAVTSWWSIDFPEDAARYIRWSVGCVFGVAYLLRAVAIYVAMKQARQQQPKKKE